MTPQTWVLLLKAVCLISWLYSMRQLFCYASELRHLQGLQRWACAASSLPERVRPSICAFGGLADGFLPFDVGGGRTEELRLASIVMKAVQVRPPAHLSCFLLQCLLLLVFVQEHVRGTGCARHLTSIRDLFQRRPL